MVLVKHLEDKNAREDKALHLESLFKHFANQGKPAMEEGSPGFGVPSLCQGV